MIKKKLIYVSHWRFPSEKTMSPLIMRTCQEFASQGFEVELWAPKRLNMAIKETDPFVYHKTLRNFKLKKLFAIDFLEIFGGKISFYLMLISFSTSVFFKALFEKESIFYSHDLRDVFFLSFLNINIFVEIHDFYDSRFPFISKFVLTKAKGIISTNLIKAEKISKKYDILRDKILHKPNAVDIEMFDKNISKIEARESLELPQNKKIILYTGSLFYWKGVDTLVETSQYLPDNSTIYLVGGTDRDITRLKKQTKGLKKVEVIGRRAHQEIPIWQKAADVLVLPNTAKFEESRVETSPVKLFEYMASGTPIIASKIPSIENIVDDKMVFLFEPDNSKDLAEKVSFVLNNPDLAKEKTILSRKEVEKYSWDKRIGDIKEFILK